MNLYIHVPFCVSKCAYCVFYSEAVSDEKMRQAQLSRYLRALREEARLRGVDNTRTLKTVYVGGGTPSLLGPKGIRKLFSILPPFSADTEVTVELNPASVTKELAEALRESGVTRVSLGVQSFRDEMLRFLGRRHDVAAAREAIRILKAFDFPVLSLDLITALPGETPQEALFSLEQALAETPDHLSLYPLSIEPGSQLKAQGVTAPEDDAALDLLRTSEAFLASHGFRRYELSNYAPEGKECRHNTAVWLGEDYTGLGPGAYSREGLLRCGNAPRFDAWYEALEIGTLPPREETQYSAQEDADERLLTRVRMRRFSLPETASPAARKRLQTLKKLVSQRILEQYAPNEWGLTPRGKEVADAVMEELL